jgi:hypothetical protein
MLKAFLKRYLTIRQERSDSIMHAMALGAAFGTVFTIGPLILGIIMVCNANSPLLLGAGIFFILCGIFMGFSLPGAFGYDVPYKKFFKKLLKRA